LGLIKNQNKMKKILILTVLMIIGYQNISAQSKVEYNFETKEPPTVTPATLGQLTVFKINNINKFLYDVKIEAKQTEYNSEPPAVFTQVFV
jgi:hypothetical protein